MKPVLFQVTDWPSLPVKQKNGESGVASYRTVEFEGFRVRLVEYSAGYKADHWCKAGHIVYCIEGEMLSTLTDGGTFTLKQGMSYVVSDDMSEHRSETENGAKLMIIDGNFLKDPSKRLFRNPWRI